MRWKSSRNQNERVVKRFPLWPKRLQNQVVWLEPVYILQYRNGIDGTWMDSLFVSESFFRSFLSSDELLSRIMASYQDHRLYMGSDHQTALEAVLMEYREYVYLQIIHRDKIEKSLSKESHVQHKEVFSL